MPVLVDTNGFIASLINKPVRGDVATEFLNHGRDSCTSILNLIEIRSVMMKKNEVEQDRGRTLWHLGVVQALSPHPQRGRQAEQGGVVHTEVDIYAPEVSDQVSAYSLQQDTLLYTLDCVLHALADDLDAALVTFDSELLDNGAVEPSDRIA